MLRLETQKLDWKQNKYIGNNCFRLETFTDIQGHNIMLSKQSIKFRLQVRLMFYIGIYFSLLCHFEQLGISSESGPKWTVQKGERGRSLKWTVTRNWTVLSQTGRSFAPKWTVIRLKVDSPLGLI